MAAKSAPDEPEIIDGRTLRLVPVRRREAQLNSLEGVRREIARVYRESESGKRDINEGARLVFMLAQLTRVLELTEIELRVRALEGRGRLPSAR